MEPLTTDYLYLSKVFGLFFGLALFVLSCFTLSLIYKKYARSLRRSGEIQHRCLYKEIAIPLLLLPVGAILVACSGMGLVGMTYGSEVGKVPLISIQLGSDTASNGAGMILTALGVIMTLVTMAVVTISRGAIEDLRDSESKILKNHSEMHKKLKSSREDFESTCDALRLESLKFCMRLALGNVFVEIDEEIARLELNSKFFAPLCEDGGKFLNARYNVKPRLGYNSYPDFNNIDYFSDVLQLYQSIPDGYYACVLDAEMVFLHACLDYLSQYKQSLKQEVSVEEKENLAREHRRVDYISSKLTKLCNDIEKEKTVSIKPNEQSRTKPENIKERMANFGRLLSNFIRHIGAAG